MSLVPERGTLDDQIDSDGDADTTFESDILIPAGEGSSATLIYLPGPGVCDRDGRPWIPTRLVVVMPNGDETEVAWPGASVDDCQAGSTRPGTFVGLFAVTDERRTA